MSTYFLYLSILLIASSSAYIIQNENNLSIRISARFICFFSMFIPAALRYGIGTDYYNYIRIYAEQFPTHRLQQMEFGFKALGLLCNKLGLPPHFFIVVVSGITYAIICFFLDRRHCFALIPLYIMALYLNSYNLIRMLLGMSIFLYGLQCDYYGKKFKGYIFYFISATIHIALLVVVFVTVLSYIKINNKLRFILVLLLPFVATFIIIYALDIIISIFPRIAAYRRLINIRPRVITGLSMIIPAIPSLIIIFRSKYIQKINKNNFIINMNLFYIILVVCGFFIQALFRLYVAFLFMPLFSIQFLYNTDTKYRKYYHYFFILIFFALFIRFIGVNEIIGANINPYRSIFSK